MTRQTTERVSERPEFDHVKDLNRRLDTPLATSGQGRR